MNSQDKTSHAGLDALRSEMAPTDLQSKILRALQPEQRSNKRVKVLKLSFATVAAVAIAATALLAPRVSVAAAISKVLKAFRAVTRYHVMSYQLSNGQRRLSSETWIDGSQRKLTLYAPDGTALPDNPMLTEVMAKIEKELHGLTPKQLLDPKLKDKFAAETATAGPGFGRITERLTVDGQEVSMSDLPDYVKKQIEDKLPSQGFMFSSGGEPDVTYLIGLLKDDSIWDISRGLVLNGRKVDQYKIKGANAGITLLVDPATSLPVSFQLNDLTGKPISNIDEFSYPSAGP